MKERDARQLVERILARATADQTAVTVRVSRGSNVRFARNSPSTSGEAERPAITIESRFGQRRGETTVNQTDDDTLAAAVTRAEEIARLAPEDPEQMPVLGHRDYPTIRHAFDADTAADGAAALPAGVKLCIDGADRKQVVAAGFAQTSASWTAIADSTGGFGYHAETRASVTETARTADARGSGWAGSGGPRIADVDFAAVSSTAVAKALASAEPRPLEPGSYPTILEASCVADLIGLFAWALDRRRADEGRSFFAAPGGGTRIGEKLFGDAISISSDPDHPELPGSPWGSERLPQARIDWVDAGTLAALSCGRYWADQQGVAPVPGPSNLIMAGGDGTLDELIASMKRGLLVTSLWYIRSLDPRTLLYTGLTRDGVFWIEDGKISHPVTNFRWNESPIRVLKNVVAMTRAQRVLGRNSAVSIAPAIQVSSFDFTSVSDAV